jgi:proteasome lid subunit RPN8/RPN11
MVFPGIIESLFAKIGKSFPFKSRTSGAIPAIDVLHGQTRSSPIPLSNYLAGVCGVSILRIKKSAFDESRSHGEEAYPHEGCGVLVGSADVEGWIVAYAVRAANSRTDSPQNRYAIAPAELVKILREAQKDGLEIAGFYHSHPDHSPMWSQIDLVEAHWLGCSYLITEVAEGHAAMTNSFRLSGTREENKHFAAEIIEIVD